MAGFGPPAVDFYNALSGLGDTIANNRKQAQRAAALDAATADGVSYGDAIRGLVKAGDLTGAQLFATLQNHKDALARQGSEDAHRTAREAVEDRFRQASFDLQKRAADRADEDKFLVKEVTDPNTGATTLVRVNTRGPEGVISTGGTPNTVPPNPYYGGGKFNGDQAKAAGFADRMLAAEGVLSGVDGGNGVAERGGDYFANGVTNSRFVPGVVSNNLVSTDFQKYDQARRDLSTAQLRRESGAAISPSEFDTANKQYFPQPGDSADVIKQKAANRRTAIEAMAREAGPSYRPKFVFDQGGRLATYNPGGGVAAIPPGAVAALKADPRRAAEFDAKFGPGAARAALGGGN